MAELNTVLGTVNGEPIVKAEYELLKSITDQPTFDLVVKYMVLRQLLHRQLEGPLLNFPQIVRRFDEENERRRHLMAKNWPLIGPQQFQFTQYYQLIMRQVQADLKRLWLARIPTDYVTEAIRESDLVNCFGSYDMNRKGSDVAVKLTISTTRDYRRAMRQYGRTNLCVFASMQLGDEPAHFVLNNQEWWVTCSERFEIPGSLFDQRRFLAGEWRDSTAFNEYVVECIQRSVVYRAHEPEYVGVSKY